MRISALKKTFVCLNRPFYLQFTWKFSIYHFLQSFSKRYGIFWANSNWKYRRMVCFPESNHVFDLLYPNTLKNKLISMWTFCLKHWSIACFFFSPKRHELLPSITHSGIMANGSKKTIYQSHRFNSRGEAE